MSSDDAGTLTLPCPEDFSLTMASKFVKNFPAAQGGGDWPALDLAFPIEGSWQPVGVRIWQNGRKLQATMVHNPAGASDERVQAEAERILNVHAEYPGDLEAIGHRDPTAGALIRHFHGLRPVQFHTPYEAAVWAILSQRAGIGQAVASKKRLACEFGTRMAFPGGAGLCCFPGPQQLLALRTFPGIAPRKLQYLRAAAHAASDGRLDSRPLVRLPAGEAVKTLQAVPGIGPFSAELILVRGAGQADYFPQQEQRLHRAMQALYGVTDTRQLETIAEKWRPLRSWVAFLIRTWQEAGCPRLNSIPATA